MLVDPWQENIAKTGIRGRGQGVRGQLRLAQKRAQKLHTKSALDTVEIERSCAARTYGVQVVAGAGRILGFSVREWGVYHLHTNQIRRKVGSGQQAVGSRAVGECLRDDAFG